MCNAKGVPMSKRYTDDEIKFLVENYSSIGWKKCSEYLKRTESSIKHKACRLNLTIPNTSTESRVNIDEIINCKTPEAAYILGLLWADGHISKDQIRLEVLYDDAVEFKKIFDRTGEWSMTYRHRRNRSKQALINLNNRRLAECLKKNGYTARTKSLTLARGLISNNLLPYWFIGIIDGDGCIYINPSKSYQLSIAGFYNQDWSPIEDIFNSIGVTYSIVNREQVQNGKINRSSVIRVTNKAGIRKISNYIDKTFDSLPRKLYKIISI
jgi:hypothetical protein